MSKETATSGFDAMFNEGLPPDTDENQTAETTVENQESSNEDESIETSVEETGEQVESTQETEETVIEDDPKAKLRELEIKLEEADKRMRDKDKYINELMNQNKKSEKQAEPEAKEESSDFWDDPEKYVKSTQQQIAKLQAELAEQSFARTKADYYEVVNINAVNALMATNEEFAKEMQSSANIYETAYLHLKKQSESVTKSQSELREQIKAEIMAELGVKERKAPPKSVSSVSSKSGGSANTASSDGFASMFGDGY